MGKGFREPAVETGERVRRGEWRREAAAMDAAITDAAIKSIGYCNRDRGEAIGA